MPKTIAAPSPMAACAFGLEDVSVRLGGKTILEALALGIAPGERVALVGPSGAGKTTFLRLLNGTVRPARGRVTVDGLDLARLGARALRRTRSEVGFVHQDHALVPSLRASANVLAGGLGRQGFLAAARSILQPRRSELERAHELLERVGIPDKLFQRTDSLSGGERQRVAIARALYQEPRALLADEPLASVDPARSRDIMELLDGLARERRISFVCSLHDLPLARAFFPRLIGLRAGRVLFDGAPEQLRPELLEQLYRLRTEGEPGAGAG